MFLFQTISLMVEVISGWVLSIRMIRVDVAS